MCFPLSDSGLKSIKMLTGRSLLAVAQFLSGAIAYYCAAFLNDYFLFGKEVNKALSVISLLFFPVCAMASLVLLTLAWHKLSRKWIRKSYPEVSMVLGIALLLPIYFELASHLIYEPRPFSASEVRRDLFWLYMLFPLSVMDILSYTFSAHVLVGSSFASLLTGFILRRRHDRNV